MILKNIPNTITCLNLLSGCMACVMAFQYNYTGVFIFVGLAAVFDFLDGLAARALHAYSDLGKELDSLSDVVSFGVAPGCLVYSFLASYADGTGLPFIAFLLPIFAALRLAKFNIDTRQTSSFLGLPVPSMGLFWVSFIPSIYLFTQSYSPLTLVIVVALVIVFSALMVSEIPMFSLKFKSLKWKDNAWSFSLVGISALILILFAVWHIFILSLAAIIVVYIGMSLIKVVIDKK